MKNRIIVRGSWLLFFRENPDSKRTALTKSVSRLCAMLLFGMAFFIASAEGSESQQRYFEGLRERQLYELIELLCEQKIADPTTPGPQRQFYLLELARTFALHARQVPLDEAEELWGQAESTLEKLPRDSVLRDVERALIAAGRAEQLFWIVQATPGNLELQQRFLQLSAQATTALQALDQPAIAQKLVEQIETTNPLEEIPLAQARVAIRRAEVLQQNIPERTAHLLTATKILQPLTRRTVRGTQELEAQLLLLAAYRLQGNETALQTLFKSLDRADLPSTVRWRATAEVARAQLAEGKYTETAEQILKLGQELGSLTSELEGLRLQALLGMATQVRQKGDDELASELESEVQLRLTRLKEQGEAYQALLIENFLQQRALQTEYGPEIARLVAQARTRVAQGKLAEADAIYAQALQLAEAQSRLPAAQQIGQQAAELLQRQQKYAAAAGLLEQVWRSSPAFPEMEQTHLQWIQALGRDYMAEPSVTRLAAYQQALGDHRERYAGKTTQAEVLWLLAELQFARLQVTQALELYQQIPANSSRFSSAQLRIGQCYRWIIERVRTLKQPVNAWEQQALQYARETLQRASQQNVNTPMEAELILLASRILLENGALSPVEISELESQIARVRAAGGQAREQNAEAAESAGWPLVEQKATALHAISLAQTGQIPAARQLLLTDQQSEKSPVEILFLAQQLAEVTVTNSELQVALSELLLQLTLPLSRELEKDPSLLTPPQRRSLFTLQARAYLELGRITPAIALYELLQQEFPTDRSLLHRLSELYLECNNSGCAEKHYRLWQKQSQREKQGSDLWLEARYRLAKAALATNRAEEARKIVQITRLLYPTAGSEILQQQYRELEAELTN